MVNGLSSGCEPYTYDLIPGLCKHCLPGSLSCMQKPFISICDGQAHTYLFCDRVIACRFIPNSVVTRPVGAFWVPSVQEPWYRLPWRLRLTIGWLCLLAIVFGSAFGFKPVGVSTFYPHSQTMLNAFQRILTTGIAPSQLPDFLFSNSAFGFRPIEDLRFLG